jgi:hypothetical protein
LTTSRDPFIVVHHDPYVVAIFEVAHG